MVENRAVESIRRKITVQVSAKSTLGAKITQGVTKNHTILKLKGNLKTSDPAFCCTDQETEAQRAYLVS